MLVFLAGGKRSYERERGMNESTLVAMEPEGSTDKQNKQNMNINHRLPFSVFLSPVFSLYQHYG